MSQRSFSLAAATVFSLVALLHVARLLLGWHVTIESLVVPAWVSWIGLVIAAGLAYQGFRLAKTRTK